MNQGGSCRGRLFIGVNVFIDRWGLKWSKVDRSVIQNCIFVPLLVPSVLVSAHTFTHVLFETWNKQRGRLTLISRPLLRV